uniref:Uncharacterized protein n=1 Tax=Micrurus corallinus TaxID=54390 RepID=A0A2D4ELP5_MICCO
MIETFFLVLQINGQTRLKIRRKTSTPTKIVDSQFFRSKTPGGAFLFFPPYKSDLFNVLFSFFLGRMEISDPKTWKNKRRGGEKRVKSHKNERISEVAEKFLPVVYDKCYTKTPSGLRSFPLIMWGGFFCNFF